ncbi:B12-binding domain-containing radical SAM protein, partial [Trichloromonas sp.]|uniref:B12-binding domain-containing radical SAM protein n=1 Tax=Trichloromonas sp. TaxID=3069249 RepID=UPI003D8145BA
MRIVLPTLHVRRSAQAVPLAAGCLKAALPEPLRAQAQLLDLFPEQSDQSMLQAILASEPKLVAFSLYVWNRRRVCGLARQLRSARPAIKLVAGGPEVFADSQAVLSEGGFDGVILGEGEETFAELALRLARGAELEPSAGLVLAEQGGAGEAPSPSPAPDLGRLPSPWLEGAVAPTDAGGVLWETSRGCPFNCTFCFDGRGSRGTRLLPLARLEKELELFVRRQVSQVWVLDSTFNHPPERGKKLLKLLARKAPHIHFHLEAKADFLDRETARLLAKLSCSVQIGLQSARPEVLRKIHRSLDPEQFAQKIQLLAREGVTYGLDLIYGLPGDDFSGFCRSLNYAFGLAPNHIDIFPLAVLPGTVLHREAADHGLRAQLEPPYEILESATMSAADLDACRLLAASADLFYNTGRAVAFFAALLKVAGCDAVSFLRGFAAWLLAEQKVSHEALLASERWMPAEALPLQEAYVAFLFKKQKQADLLPAAQDLLRYHFHYAETL